MENVFKKVGRQKVKWTVHSSNSTKIWRSCWRCSIMHVYIQISGTFFFFFFKLQTSLSIWLFPRVYIFLLFHTHTIKLNTYAHIWHIYVKQWQCRLSWEPCLFSHGNGNAVYVLCFMEYIPNYFEWFSSWTHSLPLAALVWMHRLWL